MKILLAFALVIGCAERPSESSRSQPSSARPYLDKQLVSVFKRMAKEAAVKVGADPARVDTATFWTGTTRDFERWAKDNCVELPSYDESLSSDPALRAVFVRGVDLGGTFVNMAIFDGYKEGTGGDIDTFSGGLCDCEQTNTCVRGCVCVECPRQGDNGRACMNLPNQGDFCQCG